MPSTTAPPGPSSKLSANVSFIMTQRSPLARRGPLAEAPAAAGGEGSAAPLRAPPASPQLRARPPPPSGPRPRRSGNGVFLFSKFRPEQPGAPRLRGRGAAFRPPSLPPRRARGGRAAPLPGPGRPPGIWSRGGGGGEGRGDDGGGAGAPPRGGAGHRARVASGPAPAPSAPSPASGPPPTFASRGSAARSRQPPGPSLTWPHTRTCPPRRPARQPRGAGSRRRCALSAERAPERRPRAWNAPRTARRREQPVTAARAGLAPAVALWSRSSIAGHPLFPPHFYLFLFQFSPFGGISSFGVLCVCVLVPLCSNSKCTCSISSSFLL